ncbi:MAG: phosphate regulon sensor histidine kinase PhoR, partial [Usitatibacteraceae bacterium]
MTDYVFPKANSMIGALIGMLLASIVWMFADSLRGERVLRWMRGGDLDGSAVRYGYWGEIVARARKLMRMQTEQTESADARLQAFLAAIQASPNGVMLIDQRNRIEWCNVTAADQFGLDAQRDVEQAVVNLIRAPDFIAYLSAGDYSREVVIPAPTQPSAQGRAISLQIHPYGYGSKLLLSRDITELKQVEAMRRDFVANVSHELRTPLTVLVGFIETMQTFPLEESDRRRYLGLMAQQSSRMQTLVDDLLTLSQLEGTPPKGSEVWVNATALLQQSEVDARALSRLVVGTQAVHQLEYRIEPGVEIAGAPSELQSAFANLVGNAIRYTQPGGSITVSLSMLPEGRAAFVVKDTGPGIAPEHLSRLTERFYRVDRSRSRETGGTGLGLAIVKHVAQRHGAELDIASVVGQGATFSITFPSHRVR